MGDHRANIKVEFTIHGKTYKNEWGLINYFDDGDGVDRRVKEWFAECFEDARARWLQGVFDQEVERDKVMQREADLKELARLKEKYETETQA